MPKQHLPSAQQLARAGLILRRDLVDAQLNRHLGSRVVRAGAGLRLAPATYLLGTSPTDGQLVAAAQEHAGDDLIVTGAMACRLLGITDAPDEEAVDVLVPAGRRRVSTRYVRVQPTVRPPRFWTHSSGVRVADPHRAVVDAARRMRDLQDVRALVLAMLRQRWCGLDALRRELAGAPRNGTALCRRAAGDGERGAWSAPEAEVADVAAADGRLPRFLLNPCRWTESPSAWLTGGSWGWGWAGRSTAADTTRRTTRSTRHWRATTPSAVMACSCCT